MISVVIPCFNEEERLGKSLPIIKDYFKSIGISKYEIIIVDDGSTDKTRDVAKTYKCIITPYRENKGKGYSVREGVLLAKGDLILVTDSDLATPINYFDEFIKYIPKYDIVIASRAIDGAEVTTSLFKKVAGRLSHLLIKPLVEDIMDTQCGYKLFTKEAARYIFPKCIIERWGWDIEVLYLAQKYDYRIKEHPVKWTNADGSKVKLSDYPKTFMEIIKIRRHNYE